MSVLRIEHPVGDFGAWKQAFDSDPVGRERSGVRRYRVLRSLDDPNYVMIDLEFDTAERARALLEAMRDVWSGSARALVSDPKVLIAEQVEEKAY